MAVMPGNGYNLKVRILLFNLMPGHRKHSQILLPEILPTPREENFFIGQQAGIGVGLAFIVDYISHFNWRVFLASINRKASWVLESIGGSDQTRCFEFISQPLIASAHDRFGATNSNVSKPSISDGNDSKNFGSHVYISILVVFSLLAFALIKKYLTVGHTVEPFEEIDFFELETPVFAEIKPCCETDKNAVIDNDMELSDYVQVASEPQSEPSNSYVAIAPGFNRLYSMPHSAQQYTHLMLPRDLSTALFEADKPSDLGSHK